MIFSTRADELRHVVERREVVARQARGDHEVWRSPISNRHFVVNRQMKSKHTANETLKQAGLEKAFCANPSEQAWSRYTVSEVARTGPPARRHRTNDLIRARSCARSISGFVIRPAISSRSSVISSRFTPGNLGAAEWRNAYAKMSSCGTPRPS